MSARSVLTLFLSAILAAACPAADLAKVPRTIVKEPTYATKSPRYLLLAFGPDAADRVWLVLDGDTLYVDRNGNGDLTEKGEAISTKKRAGSNPDEDGRGFEVGDLTVGGRTHKALVVGLMPLARLSEDVQQMPHARELLRADPKAQVTSITLEVKHPRLKGPGVDGRLPILAGPMDLDGFLVFAPSPRAAPVLHPDGPLAVTFYAGRPMLQLGRETDAILVVGSRGLGRGSLTMVQYDQAIPANVHPTLEIAYPAEKGAEPVRELFELKERC